MLHLVVGGPKSGKTAYLLERIADSAREGRRCLLMVPEQISFEYERMICRTLSPREAGLVSVKSFSSLCRDIFKKYGGGAKPRADGAVKLAVARRAAEKVKNTITYYRRHLFSAPFCKLIVAASDDMTRSGIGPEDILRVGNECSGARQAKFREFSLIFAEYKAILNDKYSDEQSELEYAASAIEADYFRDTSVFFDEFDGFSVPEQRFLSVILGGASDAFFALCSDSKLKGEVEAYSTPAQTARMLLMTAEDLGVEAEIVAKGDCYVKPAGIRNLCFGLTDRECSSVREGVRVQAFPTVYDEARAVAARISALARNSGLRCGEVAVITNNSTTYKAPLCDALREYGLPYYCDFGSDILSSPFSVMLCCLLELADSGFKTDTALRLLKCGLISADESVIDALEDYVYVWGVEYGSWQRPFELNPDGYAGVITEQARERLNAVEQLRQRLVSAVGMIKNKGDKDPVARLYDAAVSLGAIETIERISDESGEESDEQVRQFNLSSAALDKLSQLFSGEDADCETMLGVFREICLGTSLRNVPNCLDGVLLGEAARTRALAAKVVFLVGVNDGVFPKESFGTGLFGDSDIDEVERRGMTVQTSFERKFSIERARFLRAVCCASESLYISCSGSGQGAGLSACLADLTVGCEDFFGDIEQPLIENAASALRQYAEDGDPTIKLALSSAGYDKLLEHFEKVGNMEWISRDTALREKVFGKTLTLSPTAVEGFYKCRFSYFMKSVARVLPLKKSDLDALDVGSIFHYVLEKVMLETKADLRNADLAYLCRKYFDEYVEKNMGGEAALTPRTRYRVERLCNQLIALFGRMAKEQGESPFKPELFEASISTSGIKPRVLVSSDGTSIRMIGTVDRIDVMRDGEREYVRIIDYKTGGKDFTLSDVYEGLSVQMLIYLFSVADEGNGLYNKPVPCGIFYMPIDPKKLDENSIRMQGVTIDDERIRECIRLGDGALAIKEGDDTVVSPELLDGIRKRVDERVVSFADTLKAGDYSAEPLRSITGKSSPCDYCDYSVVCGLYRKPERKVEKIKPAEVFIEEAQNG